MIDVIRLAIGIAKFADRYSLTTTEMEQAFEYLLLQKGIAVVRTVAAAREVLSNG